MPRTREEIEALAKANNWQLNSDDKTVQRNIARQNMLKEKFGQYYCPCKPLRTKENICPCVEARKEIETTGHCHCNLFYKK